MPSDLAIDRQDELIQVRDRSGVDLPFSKGLMATSILATGLETGRAHAIAAEIERDLRQGQTREIDADELALRAAEAIERHAGKDAAERYSAWRRAKRAGCPIVVSLGGAPGVGKSTIATRLALRLGINRVVPTDAVREVLRTVVPQAVLPELHVSTYESIAGNGEADASLSSFYRQSHAVVSASVAVAARLSSERRSVILEGAHLLPGEVRRHLAERGSDAIVVELLMTVAREESHRDHLTRRLQTEPARAGQRHLQHLPVIRRLQDELQRLARAANVAEHDIAHPEDLTQRIVDQVVREIDMRDATTGDPTR
jgi:2-phosphoglycerate kinase